MAAHTIFVSRNRSVNLITYDRRKISFILRTIANSCYDAIFK